MKIAILGSTSFLGKVLVKRALEEGYEVKTLVRNPDKLGEINGKVEVVQGNYFNREDLEKEVSGIEAVLPTAGPPQRNPQFPEKYEMAKKELVSILEKHNVRR